MPRQGNGMKRGRPFRDGGFSPPGNAYGVRRHQNQQWGDGNPPLRGDRDQPGDWEQEGKNRTDDAGEIKNVPLQGMAQVITRFLMNVFRKE